MSGQRGLAKFLGLTIRQRSIEQQIRPHGALALFAQLEVSFGVLPQKTDGDEDEEHEHDAPTDGHGDDGHFEPPEIGPGVGRASRVGICNEARGESYE